MECVAGEGHGHMVRGRESGSMRPDTRRLDRRNNRPLWKFRCGLGANE